MADNWQLKAVLSANAEGMLKTLKAVNNATRSTRKHLMDVASSAGHLAANIGMPLGLIGAALGAFSVAGIKQAVTNFAELGDQAVKSAQRLGMTTDEYQRIKYVAGQSGVSVEGLASSMGRLNKGIAMAAAGKNKDLAALFQKAGISMRGANGEMRSAGDMLPEIADLFQRNGNAALQARMGNAIFGKGWQELAPLLQGGKEGIDKLIERYKMLDLTIGEDALKAGEAFGDQVNDLNEKIRNYGNTISAKLIPVLSPMIERTIQWAVANREVITTKVTAFIADMAAALEKIDWQAVIDGVQGFFRGAGQLVEMLGGARNALIGLALVMNVQAILATVSLVKSLAMAAWSFGAMAISALSSGGALAYVGTMIRVIGLALTATPIGIIFALAGAALLVWKNWDSVKKWFSSFFDWIGEKFQSLLGWAVDLAKSVGAFFGGSGGATNLSYAQAGVGAGQERQPLVTANGLNASGKIEVTFANAPPGTRVDQVAGGDVPINTDVGYRGYALD